MAKKQKKNARILYIALPDEMRKEDKLHWLATHPLKDIPFELVQPDKNNNWINMADNDFDTLLPLCDKKVKAGKSKKAIFELFSLGVVTNRDEWVYDFNEENLKNKIKFLINSYNLDVEKLYKNIDKDKIKESLDYSIKWTRAVKNDLTKGKKYEFDEKKIIRSLYRPFSIKFLYFNRELNEMQYLMRQVFGEDGNFDNKTIYISGTPASKPFGCFATNIVTGLDFIEKTQCLSLYRYQPAPGATAGEATQWERVDNITDWGLNQFTKHYRTKKITKEDVFHYVYAVLHHPAYRTKYELNLKREFPRVPLYEDFWQWAGWGKMLLDLHIGYETVAPYELAVESKQLAGAVPKAKLKADKENGKIVLDEETTLRGIPTEAWLYKLGNRSALEWILDQYKESKPKDPTIAAQFNTYRFADYKEQVIDLLKRVTTVSVETMRVVREMG